MFTTIINIYYLCRDEIQSVLLGTRHGADLRRQASLAPLCKINLTIFQTKFEFWIVLIEHGDQGQKRGRLIARNTTHTERIVTSICEKYSATEDKRSEIYCLTN